MSDDWWPSILAHISAEKPFAQDQVVVAEVRSFAEQPHAGHRTVFSALVPIGRLDELKATLVSLDHDVSSSGPHPFYSEDRAYEPKFWIEARGALLGRYEPLVLRWASHHTTVLQPDPGFLMTYGLVPRGASGGIVYWDDPRGPRRDVVVVSPPSIWDYPVGTHAFVSIAKDFLQDYLTLRRVALVQVFWELGWGDLDPDMSQRLGDANGVNILFDNRKFQLTRDVSDRSTVCAQVWGARLLAEPGELPVTSDPLDNEGLNWPGIAEPVTNAVAQTMGATDFVYVDDTVLAPFEGRAEYRVNPETGSVGHGTQWSIGYCDRVGRNVIRIELKKLYEGAPADIIRQWHRSSVTPIATSAYPAILDEPNIGTRARDLTFSVLKLGEALAALADHSGIKGRQAEDFVGLRKSYLRYHGWWNSELTGTIARHVPLALTADAFLSRCMSIEKLVVEGLSEKELRNLVRCIGVPHDTAKQWGTLKLLDCVVRVVQAAGTTGLDISKDGGLIWKRLQEEGTTPAEPIADIFALYDIRVLAAHKSSDQQQKLFDELQRLEIEQGDVAAGYGKALDRVYDRLVGQLQSAAAKIEAALT